MHGCNTRYVLHQTKSTRAARSRSFLSWVRATGQDSSVVLDRRRARKRRPAAAGRQQDGRSRGAEARDLSPALTFSRSQGVMLRATARSFRKASRMGWMGRIAMWIPIRLLCGYSPAPASRALLSRLSKEGRRLRSIACFHGFRARTTACLHSPPPLSGVPSFATCERHRR